MSKCRGGTDKDAGSGLKIVTLEDFQNKKTIKEGTQKKKK